MLNKIWFGLLCIGILYGLAKGAYQSKYPPRKPAAPADAAESSPNTAAAQEFPHLRRTVGDALRSLMGFSPEELPKPDEVGITAMGKQLNLALLDGAQTAVTICIGLIGIMALWLGMMNIAKDAGMIDAFARLARPLMRWLFPEVPDGHPAQGAILMNLSANMLGMDNAATPMGLKAMEELQTLNPVKDTATNSMALFLAINNSSVTIIPFTLIGYRALSGSASPAEPLAAILIVTLFTTVFAVMITKWLSRRPGDQIALPTTTHAATAQGGDGGSRGS